MAEQNNTPKKIGGNVPIIIAAVAIVVLIALLIPTLIVLGNKNADIENFSTQVDALKEQLAGIDTSDKVTPEELAEAIGKLEIPAAGLSEAEVKAIVDAAIAGLAGSGLTEDQVKAIVDAALAGIEQGLTEAEIAALIDKAISDIEIPEAGLSKAEIEDLIEDAIAGIEISGEGLTEEEVKAIVDAAIAGIKIPEAGLNEAAVKALIDAALAGIKHGLTAEEVQAIVDAAVAGIELGLSAEEVKAIVDAAIAELVIPEIGVTKAEVEAMIAAALAAADKGLTEAQVQALIDAALAAAEQGLSAEEVKALIDEAIAKIEHPNTGLTAEEVKAIVDAAIAAADKGLTEKQVQALIDAAIAAADQGLTAEEVKALIEEAIAKIEIPEAGLTAEEVKAIVDAAIAGVDTGLTADQVQALIDAALAAADKGLSAEEVKAIVDAAIEEVLAIYLKEGLQSGGNYFLIGDITLDSVIIPEGVVASLDLNGYTLTMTGAWEIYGELTIEGGDIIIEVPEEEDDIYEFAGVSVGNDELEAGTLILENVTIEANRLWNIDNYSEVILTDVHFIVNGGYGIANNGNGVVVIEDCTFVSNGDAASPLYNLGGKMTVIGCEFTEGSQFGDYYYRAPIEVYGGEVILDGVTVTTSVRYSVFASTNGEVIIINGDFNSKFLLVGDPNSASITIYGGTVNGIAYADITADSAIFEGFEFKLMQGEGYWLIIRPLPDVDLKEALQSGGSYSLVEDTVLEDVIIPDGIVSSLNLRGFTLTVRGAWEIYGELGLVGGAIVIEVPEEEDDIYEFAGISVGSDEIAAGTLIIESATVVADRLWNIDNYSEVYFTDVIFIGNAGYGIANNVGAVAVVEDSLFVANGDAASPLYALGGKMTVIGCDFFEGIDFEGYYYKAPIEAYAGEIILDDVTVTTSTRYSVFASTDGKVTIISGNFNNMFLLVGDANRANITIYDGVIVGIDFEDIDEASAIFEGFNFKLVKGDGCWIIVRTK